MFVHCRWGIICLHAGSNHGSARARRRRRSISGGKMQCIRCCLHLHRQVLELPDGRLQWAQGVHVCVSLAFNFTDSKDRWLTMILQDLAVAFVSRVSQT